MWRAFRILETLSVNIGAIGVAVQRNKEELEC